MTFLKKLIPVESFKKTTLRFPLSTVCSLTLCLLILLSIHDVIDVSEEAGVFGRLMVLSAYGFFWFGLARLIADGQRWTGHKEDIMAAGVFMVLAGFVFFGSGFNLAWLLALMIPALLLGISVGPYLSSRDDLSLWFYNSQLWHGVSVSILAGILWGAGLSAALATIHILFSVKIPEDMYADIWAMACIVFGPLYALSWVPEKYSYTEADCHKPPQLSFVLNWVMVPLLLVYMLILYAYFVKILFFTEIPRQQLSYMITAFGGVGILTYLAGWPLRDMAKAPTRLFYKIFFPALLVPVAIQAFCIYLRVEQYGITEARYIVILAAIWMGVIAVLYTASKPPLKIIPGLLAVLLVIAAVGPLSAPNISIRNQTHRLETVLTKTGLLKDGKIVKADGEVEIGARRDISSILAYLKSRKADEKVRAWFSVPEDKDVSPPEDLTRALGFEFTHDARFRFGRGQNELASIDGSSQIVRQVTGYDYFLGRRSCMSETPHCGKMLKWENAEQPVTGTYEDGILTVDVPPHGRVKFDISSYALAEYRKDPVPYPYPRPLSMEGTEGNLRVKLIFTNIAIKLEPEPKLRDFSIEILVDVP